MKVPDSIRKELLEIYRLLFARFGPLNWWPGETPFEVMVGAILTQNTAWTNVEKAMKALKQEDMLSPEAILKADTRKLKRLIRPSGYFNQKALRLKEFVRFIVSDPYQGQVERLAAEDAASLRQKLLSVRGIGPETADSILLYALEKPVFVVDAYTRRSFSRLGFLAPETDYQLIQDFFTTHLPKDLKLYNDYHAQIVYLGKEYCKTRPLCSSCPLNSLKRCQVPDQELPPGRQNKKRS